MRRSATRRDDTSSNAREAVPPGKKSAHGHGDALVGPSLLTTETSREPEKRSRPRTRPLTSSTNSSTAVPTRNDVVPRTSQSHRKMGRSPTPMPPDENEDWIEDQNAPPIPDRSRMRTRTSSAGGSRGRVRSEERKLSSAHHLRDASHPPSPASCCASAAGTLLSAPQDEFHGNDGDQDAREISDGRIASPYIPQGSKSAQDVHLDDNVSAGRSNSHQIKPKGLGRKHSWGRRKNEPEESITQESSYRRASQLGLPELEKDLLPSLRDTVHKMTGSNQTSSEGSKCLQSSDPSGVRSYNSPGGTLSPPSTYGRAKSPTSHSLRSSTLPLPLEPTPITSRHQEYDRSKDAKAISSLEFAACGYGHLDPTGQDSASSINTVYKPKYAGSPNADTRFGVSFRSSENSGSTPKSILKPSLKIPRSMYRQQELSPNLDADGSAPDPVLRTPRERSSSRAHAGPLLPINSSPKQSSTNIPSPRLRSRSSLSAMRSEKSPAVSQSIGYRTSISPITPRSSVPPTNRYNTASRSSSSVQVSTRVKPSSKLVSSRSPAIGSEDRFLSREGTPKASYSTWKHEEHTLEIDSSADEKLLVAGKFSLSRPPSGVASSNLYSQADFDHDRSSHYKSPLAYENSRTLNVDQTISDTSEHEIVHSDKASEDSHARRQNELVDLVTGLNLAISHQESGHCATSAYSVRGASSVGLGNAKEDFSCDHFGPSDEGRQDSFGIALGSSSVANNDLKRGDDNNFSPRSQNRASRPEVVHQADPPSHRSSSLKRLSSTPKPAATDINVDANKINSSLKPDGGNVNRDSLLMLNAERQREAFGIPPPVSDVCEGSEMLSSAGSNASMRNPALDSEWEGEANNGLGLSLGAEKLFHTLGIGADACQVDGRPAKGQRTSWRSSMAEAEKYIAESLRPGLAPMSASSSNSSMYEDGIPDRPWQKRERDLDRVQSVSGSSIKSSWRRTLSHSAYMSLLERHGEVEMRRQEVIWELCETEQAFLKSLRTVLRIFVHPLLGRNRTWISGLPSNVSRLLDWLDDIFQLHVQISSALQHARSSQYPVVLRIAETLRTFVPRLEVYQPYIVRLDDVVDEIEGMMKDPKNELGEFFRIQSASGECVDMTFSSFLWLPLTRLGRYLKHFNELWGLTPRSHVDHLPTFSLLHSATMVVRVMREVKLREEEYTFVKDLVSRIRGLPDVAQLIRRERRLVAHGALRRVHLSERSKDILEGNVNATSSQRSQAGTSRRGPERHVEFSRHKVSYHRRRANSLDSCLTSELSDTASMNSVSSAASNFALDGNDMLGYTSRIKADTRDREAAFGVRSMQRVCPKTSNISLRDKSRTTPLYAFIFTDLALFTVPMSSDSDDGNRTIQDSWKLLDDIGICRVLSVTNHSGKFDYDHLVGLHVLPMDLEQLDSGILSDTSSTSMFIHLPRGSRKGPEHSDARKRWWNAFEQCYLFTLRSLSFPTHSGRYLTHGPGSEQDVNTRQTVMSILASGLPLPKSPSIQIEELGKGLQSGDAALKEREERGWWALRFQQTLREVQREDLLPPSLQRTASLPSPASARKTVSGRRRLKLGNGRK